MHSASLFSDTRLEDVHNRLLAHYGPPEPRELWDPLTQMIYSMLSSRTKTEVSHAVLRALQTRFSTWDNLRDASIPEIEDTIRPVTFPEPKAINLKSALVRITERQGSLDLSFLARYSTEKIRAWLEKFEGVGVKTSAAVVNFSTLRRRAICVDSHHLRIVQRLGFVNKSATAPAKPRPASWRWLRPTGHPPCWTITTPSSSSTARNAAPSRTRTALAAPCAISAPPPPINHPPQICPHLSILRYGHRAKLERRLLPSPSVPFRRWLSFN